MTYRTYALLALALVGCTTTESVSRTESEVEVRELSLQAVEEAGLEDTSVSTLEVAPIEPEGRLEIVALEASYGDSLLEEAVPSAASIEIEEEAAPEVATTAFELRRGETLAHFARWAEVPVELIAETSGLDLGGMYPVGTEILVPVTGEELAALESRRTEHHTVRLESYLATRGGSVGTEAYMVRTGDSAWSISHNQQGIPVWVLEEYNPGVSLDRLRPGQELLVPVLADIVVDAEPVSE